jgi:hypothetical protein
MNRLSPSLVRNANAAHVMVLAGKALEEVRLQLQREGAQAQRGDVELTRHRLEFSVQSVKRIEKTSVASTLNLAVR